MSYEIDAVDRQIVGVLQEDGRTPNVEIARRVGVSEATVRKRLERLLADGAVRITAVPDSGRVGLSTVTFLTFDVDVSQVDKVADRLARSPEVRAIYYTTGAADLILEAWFPSKDALLRFLTQQVAAIPGIKKTATSHVLRTVKDSCSWQLPSGFPPRVLVVDDDVDFVEITRLALVSQGYSVNCANSGEQALAMMRVDRPDLVIMDVMMRGILDGVRTGREMRSDGELRTVPILMVSSITTSAFAGLLPKEQDLPVDNFLVKPVDTQLLVAEVRRLLRTR